MTPDIRLYPRGATPGHLYRDAKVYKPLVNGQKYINHWLKENLNFNPLYHQWVLLVIK